MYCYKVISFGLKNAGATYQRPVNKMFAKLIGISMEIYVDDMLVKSLKAENHAVDLEATFSVLRQYKIKLNPKKCVFRVAFGKFLGFIVNQHGIEANQVKVQAIIDMEPPKRVKGIQKLMDKVTALIRYISR